MTATLHAVWTSVLARLDNGRDRLVLPSAARRADPRGYPRGEPTLGSTPFPSLPPLKTSGMREARRQLKCIYRSTAPQTPSSNGIRCVSACARASLRRASGTSCLACTRVNASKPTAMTHASRNSSTALPKNQPHHQTRSGGVALDLSVRKFPFRVFPSGRPDVTKGRNLRAPQTWPL